MTSKTDSKKEDNDKTEKKIEQFRLFPAQSFNYRLTSIVAN